MRALLCVAVFAGAMLANIVAASAQVPDENETLAAFLARCNSDAGYCLHGLKSGFQAANDMGEVCAPSSVTDDDAAQAELAWLRNASAYNSGLANGKEMDAEWTALHTLWPCAN